MPYKPNGAGRGNVKLEDGRVVKLWSPEHKEVLAAKRVVKDPPTEEGGPSFTPPPPPIGVPKIDPEVTSKKSKKEDKTDEIEDLKQLVAAFFYGIAAATGTPEYKFSEPEAEAVAKPLSRIVARNSRIRKVVQQVADPIALVGAVAFPLMVKHAAAEQRKKRPTMQAPPEQPVTNVQTQSTTPPPPPRNGTIPMESVLNRISEGA
jgi:hypothetical protein